MKETTVTDAALLRRLDQMAIEIERLRQQILESMAAKRQRKRVKSVREYEACGMWADREEWEGMTTEEIVEWIRERAWRGAYPSLQEGRGNEQAA
jgi:hypothetical protein